MRRSKLLLSNFPSSTPTPFAYIPSTSIISLLLLPLLSLPSIPLIYPIPLLLISNNFHPLTSPTPPTTPPLDCFPSLPFLISPPPLPLAFSTSLSFPDYPPPYFPFITSLPTPTFHSSTSHRLTSSTSTSLTCLSLFTVTYLMPLPSFPLVPLPSLRPHFHSLFSLVYFPFHRFSYFLLLYFTHPYFPSSTHYHISTSPLLTASPHAYPPRTCPIFLFTPSGEKVPI